MLRCFRRCEVAGSIRWEQRGAGKIGERLDASFLPWATSVVRDRGDFLDQFHVQASSLEGCDCTFATRTWAFDTNFDVTHTELGCFLSSLLSGTLSGEGGALSASLESAGSGAGPAKSVAFGVGNGYRRVVKGCVNVRDAIADVATDAFFLVGLCHRWVSSEQR